MTPYDILKMWTSATEQRDIEQVMALYEPRAVLIPTFVDVILDTPTKIRAYFERLMGRQGLKISLHEKTLREQILPTQLSILSGIYTWKFLVEDELITYEARFSFILNAEAAAPIMHHHSSQIPRMV